jgi:hypothetical protein
MLSLAVGKDTTAWDVTMFLAKQLQASSQVAAWGPVTPAPFVVALFSRQSLWQVPCCQVVHKEGTWSDTKQEEDGITPRQEGGEEKMRRGAAGGDRACSSANPQWLCVGLRQQQLLALQVVTKLVALQVNCGRACSVGCCGAENTTATCTCGTTSTSSTISGLQSPRDPFPNVLFFILIMFLALLQLSSGGEEVVFHPAAG